MPTKTIIEWLREHAKGADFTGRYVFRQAAARLEMFNEELMFTRKFIHEHGLEHELGAALDRGDK